MIISRDEIKTFIPKKNPKLVILGTMASINARTINGHCKSEEPFYYNNNQNRFWKIMQVIFDKNPKPGFFENVAQKKIFLEKHQIALANIVYEIEISNGSEKNASDEIIFEANNNKQLKVKKIEDDFKTVLQSTPVFFTCLNKPKLNSLLNKYYKENNLNTSLIDKICYLHSPTRVKYELRSEQWREQISLEVKL